MNYTHSNTPFLQPRDNRLLLNLQQALLLQVLDNLLHGLLDRLLVGADVDLGLLGRLVRRADARELWDLAGARHLVQALGVACLGHLERQVDEDLNESQRRVLAGCDGVQLARCLAVGLEGRDEGCDGDRGAVGEELGDLRGGTSVSRSGVGRSSGCRGG